MVLPANDEQEPTNESSGNEESAQGARAVQVHPETVTAKDIQETTTAIGKSGLAIEAQAELIHIAPDQDLGIHIVVAPDPPQTPLHTFRLYGSKF